MANYDKLRLHIQNYIKGNGNREITGFLLQDVLLSIVDTLGDDIIKFSSTSCNIARNSELLEGHPASYFAIATDFNRLASTFEDMFYITEDGESIGTRHNFFSEKEVSANGLSIGSGGSGGGLISQVYGTTAFGTIASESNSATFNAYAIDSLYKRIVLLENKEVDLTGYATETWVLAKNYITSAALSPYLKTADANSTFATLAALNALSNRFDALDDALNDDVSGKINTWNEIVDFLDEYSGSEDLATVLSGMNADIASRLKSSDFDTWKTDVYSPLAKRVSTAEGNISANATAITNLGKRVTANEGNIAEILKWFAVDSDGNLYTTYNFYSTKEISANGLSIGSGGSGGGLISQVYGTTAFGTIAAESNSATFNAYAIDSLYKRIVSLEGKATAVSFVPALTSGKQIGTLSIDGVSTVLYGVDAYSKAEADGTFLKLSGGTISNGNFNPLTIKGNSTYSGIGFVRGTNSAGYLVYEGGANWSVTSENWAAGYKLIHSGNYSQYALPLSGGSLTGQLKVTTANWAQQIILDTSANSSGINLSVNGALSGIIRGDASHNLKWYYSDSNDYAILHSGNYNSYAPKRDGTGASGTWGIDISGTARYLKTSAFTAVNANELTYTNCALRYISALAGSSTNLPATTSYQNAILTLSLHDNGSTAQLYFTKGVENFYYRSQHTGDWKTVAFTDSNVASATKLATARTIWGQSFDGSRNIYGTISNTYGILPNSDSAHDIGSATNQYRYVYASWFGAKTGAALSFGANNGTHIFVNSSGNVTIGSSDLASTTSTLAVKNILRVNDDSMNAILNVTNEGGTINYVHLFVSSANSSNTTTRPLVLQNGYGNVGIGINSPQYKLHVAGTARVSGETSIGGTLGITGVVTANSGIKVASGQAITFLDASGVEHKLTYDSTAGAFKFDGNLYATGEVSGNGLHTN